jgi:small subunit ribosomal protein S16
MLQIRLLRVGKKHHPYFRLVLVNKGKRPGKYLENLGFYSPTDKKNRIQNLEAEKIKYWISKGAQTTPTVHNVLVDAKAISASKTKIKISKSKKPAETPKTEIKPEAAKPAEAEAKPAEKPAPAAEALKAEEKPAEAKPA